MLIELAGHTDPQVRSAAALELSNVGSKGADLAAPVLLRLLEDDAPQVREHAVLGVARLVPRKDAIAALIAAYDRLEPYARRRAARELVRLDATDAIKLQ